MLRVLQPADPTWPRYSARPFPAYRYVPGVTPHPRRDARGHSHGAADPVAPTWQPEQWATLDHWLYGVDLFNYAYWWESHEQLEALWHAAGRTTEHARFVQGVIKIAAACLNSWLGKSAVAREQGSNGLAGVLDAAPTHGAYYMGIDVRAFEESVAQWLSSATVAPPLIALHFEEKS